MAKGREYKKLYRSETERMLGGVSGGLGEYFEIDPTLIRLIFVLLTVFGGSGIIIYIILWAILPSRSNLDNDPEENIRQNADEIKSKAKSFAKDFKGNESESRQIFGGLIILLGILFIFSNVGIFDFHVFWPLILIFLGLAILWKK